MEKFEIHITGDRSIHAAIEKLNRSLDAATIRTISIDLLTPDREVLRTQHMTSFVIEHVNFGHCMIYTLGLLRLISKHGGVNIVRTKVECQYHKHYVDRSLYLESHFPVKLATEFEFSKYPISRSQHKTMITGTDRVYDHSKYDEFREQWLGKTVELCLHDSNVTEDKDWFDLWPLWSHDQ